MGCHWYDIVQVEEYGILISNKMIKKAHDKPGATLTKYKYHEPLDSDTIEWMASRVKEFSGYGFGFYNVGNAFTFVSQRKKLRVGLGCSLQGPDEPLPEDEKFYFHINPEITPRDNGEKVRQDLIHLAQKLTPNINELSFQPGYYVFSRNHSCLDISNIELYSQKACNAPDSEKTLSTDDKGACKARKLTTNHSPGSSIDCKISGNTQSSFEAEDDATFIVGHDKTHITTKRAVLAATNPVLQRMLYGVGLIKVDPAVPIVWSEFDTEVVQAVFETLQNKKDSILVPSSKVSAAKDFLDFIGETGQIDVCRSDIGFEEVNEDMEFSVRSYYIGDDSEVRRFYDENYYNENRINFPTYYDVDESEEIFGLGNLRLYK